MQITVLGDGTFGTALAQTLASNGHHILLWCYNPEVAHSIEQTGYNAVYMPGVKLYPTIAPTTSLEEALMAPNSLVIEAIPVTYLRSVLTQCKPFVDPTTAWVVTSKGIEAPKVLLPTEIIKDILGNELSIVVLSGPSFAQELIVKQPTALTLASTYLELAEAVKVLLQNDALLIETSLDEVGVQWCGALKNVIAVALGIVEGAGYGTNSQALVCTKMIHELKQVIMVYGGDPQTVLSFAGIGDIMLTSYSSQSRNRETGRALGKKEIAPHKLPYTEGINSLQAIPSIIKLIKIPVFEAVYEIVYNQADVASIFTACKKI